MSVRHLCFSVDGMLALKNRDLDGWASSFRVDGKPCGCGEEVRKALQEAKAEGWKYIPSAECDNFDPIKGCLGHPDKKVVKRDD